VSATRAELTKRGQDPDLLVADESSRALGLPLLPGVDWFMYFSTSDILNELPEVVASRFSEAFTLAQQLRLKA
jgi:hypothetical protein